MAGRKNTSGAMQRLIRAIRVSGVDVSESTVTEWNKFRSLPEIQRLTEARKIISEMVIEVTADPSPLFTVAVGESETLLPGYTTLDLQHRNQIKSLIGQITDYVHDSTRKRPLNALMIASPGAGKSHFIKQIAAAMRKEQVRAVTFNMAMMQSADDMARPIDEVRNLKVNDQFPLLFLDEFDSDEKRYASLLPLLWDGQLQVGHRDLKLGRAVIVLAGSSPELPKVMDRSGAMKLDADAELAGRGKLVDLLSRINGGVIEIPDLDLRSENRDRRVDKVCVTIALLKARFGRDLKQVPRTLLRFVAHTQFRYGVRSIAHLIDLIRTNALKENQLKLTGLPLNNVSELQESSLRLHLLDKDEAFGIANRWKEFSKDNEMLAIHSDIEYFVRLGRTFDFH
jgi:hypothetical protein